MKKSSRKSGENYFHLLSRDPDVHSLQDAPACRARGHGKIGLFFALGYALFEQRLHEFSS